MSDKKKSLINIITDSDLKPIISSLGEPLIDEALNGGYIEKIPLLGALFGSYKFGTNVIDRVNKEKIRKFLNEMNETTKEERKTFLQKAFKDEDEVVKFFYRLNYILERIDDVEKAKIIGKLFINYIKEKISKDEFLRASSIVDKAYLDDLYYFLANYTEYQLNIPNSEIETLLSNYPDNKEIDANLANLGLLKSEGKIINNPGIGGQKNNIILKYELTLTGNILLHFGFRRLSEVSRFSRA